MNLKDLKSSHVYIIMNFPISRKRLQNLGNEFEESQLEYYIKDILEDIKAAILVKAYVDAENITAISLHHAYKSTSAAQEVNIPKCLKINLPIRFQIAQHIATRWNPRLVRAFSPDYIGHNDYLSRKCLPIIVERLKTLFPDVTFTVDPLQTYLFIDWS